MQSPSAEGNTPARVPRLWPWFLTAAACLGLGGLGALAIRGPSLGVRAQIEIEGMVEELARWAGERGGVFPPADRPPEDVPSPARRTDPWGRPYRYEVVAPKGPIRVWSLGPDGRDDRGGADDIASWTR